MAHPAPRAGLCWVKAGKERAGATSVTAAEVNDVVLCHGRLTGTRTGLNGAYFLRLIPRRPGGSL
ncbi:hypothetical protein ACFP51_04360 [Streptomyces pratens]|uniref:Transposase n=1 Tax=Streptomyces pratens TaxID=887456 RepID=A0ABW1LWW7_9ACTN